MSTDKKVSAAIQEWLRNQQEEMTDTLGDWCESPIEQLFMIKLLASGRWSLHLPDFPFSPARDHLACLKVAEEAGITDHGYRVLFNELGLIFPQASVKMSDGTTYRLDFAYVIFHDKYALEFDGHDFHEKTKEQARRDKQRDRSLTLAGWKVLRFTGSETYRDPDAIVDQIHEIGMDAVDREFQMSQTAKGRK
jgi:hypothetical protein